MVKENTSVVIMLNLFEIMFQENSLLLILFLVSCTCVCFWSAGSIILFKIVFFRWKKSGFYEDKQKIQTFLKSVHFTTQNTFVLQWLFTCTM
mgnify:CR=1 FL=1